MSLIPRAEARARDKPRNAAMRKPKAPEASRAAIVAAAIDEFAARGFKGASMDAIAARTHTTRALINYYFGSKEKLDLDHLAPEDALRRIVEFTYGYYLSHEGFVRLVVAENQARGRQLRKSKAMRTLNRPIIERLSRVIARGQAEGRFRRDVDPVEVHKSIAALGMFNVTNRHTFGAIFQRDMGAQGDVARRRDIVADIILSYLTNLKRNRP
jgi:AcrR family transcriptional regulator